MRRLGIGLAAVCATLLSSCATGQQAQTAHEVPAIDATSGSVGSIQLHDVAIKAPATGSAYRSGDAAQLQLVIVNVGHDTDTLQSITSPAAAGYAVFASAAEASAAASPSPSSTTPGGSAASGSPAPGSPAPGSGSASGSASGSPPASGSTSGGAAPVSLDVLAGHSLPLGVTDTAAVLLLRITKTLFTGTPVQITFTFAKAGSVTLTVPVQLTTNTSPAGISVAPPASGGSG